MSLREKLNKNPALTAGIGIVLIGAAALVAYLNDRASRPGPPLTDYYYTIDDGKTYFADQIGLVPPFMHQGKEAVLAHVYTCKDGAPFVGYLEKFKDDYAQKRAAAATAPAAKPGAIPSGPPEGLFAKLVKKPGEAEWHPFTSEEGQKSVLVTCDKAEPKDLDEIYPQ